MIKPLLSGPLSPPPRYATQTLPALRYIPGVGRHPHAFLKPQDVAPKSPVIFIENDATHPLYLLGVDLYNQAFWWESHEAFETLWQTLDKSGLAGQYLQGLIQISAAFIKWYSSDGVGAQKLFELGFKRLSFVAETYPIYMGVDLPEHLSRLKAHFKAVREEMKTDRDPLLNYPFILIKENT